VRAFKFFSFSGFPRPATAVMFLNSVRHTTGRAFATASEGAREEVISTRSFTAARTSSTNPETCLWRRKAASRRWRLMSARYGWLRSFAKCLSCANSSTALKELPEIAGITSDK